jgi:hypothetical protein
MGEEELVDSSGFASSAVILHTSNDKRSAAEREM